MVKVIGVIRPKETREIAAEADRYSDAYAVLQASLPEGWSLQSVRIEP